MTIILTPTESLDLESTSMSGDELWVAAGAVAGLTGYELKPEGFCRNDVCVRVPHDDDAAFVRHDERGTTINLAALWRLLDAPIVTTEKRDIWALGEPPADRGARLESLEAPDFTLPDIDGVQHSLSDYRGNKVLLIAWASW